MNPDAYTEMDVTEAEHWWFRGRRAIVADVLRTLALPPSARILEVGCGTGGNLAMLSAFGRIDATEMDAYARARASAKSGLVVRAGSLPDDIDCPDQAYDLVCMFDVLEHVDDDAAALRRLSRLPNDGGRILLTVPAYQWLWSTHDEVLHHRRRYTARSLRQVCVAAGLSCLRMTYFNTLLFPAAAATRGLNKLGLLADGAATKTPPPAVNAALYRVFASEASLLRYTNLPFGVSLLAMLAPQ